MAFVKKKKKIGKVKLKKIASLRAKNWKKSGVKELVQGKVLVGQQNGRKNIPKQMGRHD